MPTFDYNLLLKQFLYDPENPLLFNNGFFVFFFFMFICLYHSYRNNYKVRRYIFCFFSLYFFYKASGYFVGFVIISAVVDFILSNAIFRQKNHRIKLILLFASIAFNLGMLFYFKYTNFFISLSNNLFDTGFNSLNILLPVGISFYTFENLSYTIDIFRGQFEPAKKFSDYLLFLSFFPKLVMGPIVRAHDFVPQINKPYNITDNDFAKGFYLIISGLFKKLIISDYITLNFVNYVFDDPSRYTGMENLFAVYGYAIVIYCDFSGYSDIALGIARWLGFNIPTNFLSPYQSQNITEFWRRWHISLSTWLRDYLYIPLGGNRKGTVSTYIFAVLFFAGSFFAEVKVLHLSYLQSTTITLTLLFIFFLPALMERKRIAVSTNFNLLTIMLLGGFWHGASWNFILWGALHGVGLVVHKIWILITGKNNLGFKKLMIFKAIAIFVTFNFVCFTWIFFKTLDFVTAQIMIKQIWNNFNPNIWNSFFNNYKGVIIMMFFAFLLHAIPDEFADHTIDRFSKIPMLAYIALFFVFIICYGFFKSAEPVLPIYLQF